MTILGARLLESQRKVGETAQAIELRQAGENCILADIAGNVSDSLDQVLRWVYWWNSTVETPNEITGDDVLMRLNSDFNLSGISAQNLNAAVAAWQAGAMSRDPLFDVLRRGEILPDGRTNEEEARLVGAEKPSPSQAPNGDRSSPERGLRPGY